jgi:hypothetical protein
METRKQMPKRQRPEFAIPPRGHFSDPVISRLRRDRKVVVLYVWLTHTLVPFFLAVVFVVPIGAVLLLFYLPKFYRNWRRRRKYGVELIHETWASDAEPITHFE